MTPIEEAYNQGVAAATEQIRQVANRIPKNYALPGARLAMMADEIDALKHVDPPPADPAAEVAA